MLTTTINPTVEYYLANNDEPDEIALESFEDFITLLRGFASYLSNPIDKILNNEINAVIVEAAPFTSLANELKQNDITFNDLKDLNVYRPEYMKGFMMDLSDTLVSQVTDVMDIQDRLVDPLIQWTALVLNKPETVSSPITQSKFKMVDLDNMKKEMSGFFSKKLTRKNEQPDLVPIRQAYRTEKQMQTTGDNLLALEKLAKSIRLDILHNRELELAKQVDELIDLEENQSDPDSKFTIPDYNRNILKKLVIATAKETEYFANLLYMISVATSAWNDTLKKLTHDIADILEEAEAKKAK